MPTSVTFVGNDINFEVTGTPRSDSSMLILQYSGSSFPIAANTQTTVGPFPIQGAWSAFLISGTFDDTPTDFNLSFFLQGSPLISIEKDIVSGTVRFLNESATFFMKIAAINESTNSFLFYMGFEQIFIPPMQLELLSDESLTVDRYIVYSAASPYNMYLLRERPGPKLPYTPNNVC